MTRVFRHLLDDRQIFSTDTVIPTLEQHLPGLTQPRVAGTVGIDIACCG